MSFVSARIEVYSDSQGGFRWRLRARNSRIQADSGQAFSTRDGAKRGAKKTVDALCRTDLHIASVRDLGTTVLCTSRGRPTLGAYKDSERRFRWHLRASNGRIQADSGQSFYSPSKVNRAIESVLKAAADPALEFLDADRGWTEKRLFSENV